MQSENKFQITLILLGLAAAIMFALFFKREILPEYKIYQNDFIALEKFRSSYTGEPESPFQVGIKQILLPRSDNGPAEIDRCISCHVALEISDYSPTKLLLDAEGKPQRDANGIPIKEPNENYIWKKLDQKIAELRDPQVLEHLRQHGESNVADQHLKQAEEYEKLKRVIVDGITYDVKKLLTMHPLIGKETRPFEFHSVDEYGCVSCHNGNGRGITTDKAHGPIFDGTYEEAETGHKAQFLEKDPLNDPPFAQMFNHMPGDKLLFQTTPLLIGRLIEAKCIQCHQEPSKSIGEAILNTGLEKHPLGILQVYDSLKNYQKGEELYLSQACYACHRIAGFARGGVGPELTFAGNSYPWFLKESIVWPQADLPTSTMPNFRLDHEEVEKLMTFLLGQNGKSKADSDVAYKIAIQAWETGQKKDWEKPITPTQMHDLRYGMTVFATQGCAACHRLKGFESHVGFALEKDKKANFDEVYAAQQWFSKLFPEQLLGSEIVNTIQSHQEEIDTRIINHVRSEGLLDEINNQFPDLLESYYASFKFASRAKNNYYSEKINAEKDPDKKMALQSERQAWKDRIERILLVYIQQYGLGRLVGPRPNWSGIYRSDEWLMEHFRNPGIHIPGSIMPVFPFDDTKFYALTNMLDQLAIRNRDAVREIWKHEGFNPALAAHIFCSQCHGEFLLGNGPVSEWLYPIPKNLRNADFLRNMTKENIIHSITHGMPGTPMPPWGEVALDKVKADHIPVLTKDEIQQLADWLFSQVPGAGVIRKSAEVPKWQYQPEDVIKELKEESSWNQSDQFFEAVTDPQIKDGRSYYIKKKFYTIENIDRGRSFFLNNCAVCHGSEADGSGIRAEIMQDAKPRMLINLDWQKAHDDLYMLRSIKYGVPGTSMTPWGDLTSSLQRLQLVIYIRSKLEEQKQRDQILEAIFQSFDTAMFKVERSREVAYKKLEALKAQDTELKQKEHAALEKENLEEAANIYKQIHQLAKLLEEEKKKDQHYLALKGTIKAELELYRQLGLDLLQHKISDEIFNSYLDLIKLYEKRYLFDNGVLGINPDLDFGKAVNEFESILLNEIDKEMKTLEEKQAALPEGEEKAHLLGKMKSLKGLKERVAKTLAAIRKLDEEQTSIF